MPTFELPEDFDRDCYLRMNPDVAAAGLDPSAHYLRYGQREGRIYKPRPALLQAQMGEDVFDFDGLNLSTTMTLWWNLNLWPPMRAA